MRIRKTKDWRAMPAALVPRSLRARLALIALAGLAVRLAYAHVNRDYPVIGDAFTFHLDAQHLADGDGFRRPDENVPTAEHPPGFIVLLAFADLIGLNGLGAQKAFMGCVGTITVVLIGLLGARVAGERAGLIAAALAAIYPMLWLADGALMSETLYGVFVVGSLLAAYAYRDRPSARHAALLGALIALATLTRGEALALLVLLLLPLAWRAGAGRGAWWRDVLIGLAAFAIVLAPWTIRNLTTFDAPVLVSTNSNGIWVGANCHDTYYGEHIGSWVFACYGKRPRGDEAEQNVAYRKRGMRYLRHHVGRLPVVMAVRLGRLLDVYRPWTQGVFFNGVEGRRSNGTKLGLIAYWLLLPFGLAGALVLRRRRRPLLVLLAPVVMVLAVAIVTYGTTRFRFAAEPVLVVLAAVALDAAWRRRPAASDRAA